MTKEEALKVLDTIPTISEQVDALEMAIKALEQQPCTNFAETSQDCISKESVRQLICKNNDKYGYSDRFHEFTEECLQLPSVTPQPKRGKWIEQNDTSKHHYGWYYCSECGAYIMSKCNYCSECGSYNGGDEE